jgi:hypothetical protein
MVATAKQPGSKAPVDRGRAYSPTEAGGPAYDADTARSFDDATHNDSAGSRTEPYSRELDPLDALIAKEEAETDSNLGFDMGSLGGLDTENYREVHFSEDRNDGAHTHDSCTAAEIQVGSGAASSTGALSEDELYRVQEQLSRKIPQSWDEDFHRLTRHSGYRCGETPVTDRQRGELDARKRGNK